MDAKRFELDCGPNLEDNAFSRNAEVALNFEMDEVESISCDVGDVVEDDDDDAGGE
jgi:hypothetical protein